MNIKFLNKSIIQPKQKLVSLMQFSAKSIAFAGNNANLMFFNESSDCDFEWDCYDCDCDCDCFKEPKRTTKKQMHVLRKYGNLSESELKKMSKREKQEKVNELMEEYRAAVNYELYYDFKDCDCWDCNDDK